jgi:hypothetical protein
MTLDLPFAVAPAKTKLVEIGTKQTGILKLPSYGSLLVGETITVTDLLGDSEAPIVASARLAQRIAGEQEVSLVEAFDLINLAIGGGELSADQERIRIAYLQELVELTKAFIDNGTRRKQAAVTALLRHRADRPEWALEATTQLPTLLFEQLFEFYERERQAADPDSGEPASEEAIKKQPPGTTNAAR